MQYLCSTKTLNRSYRIESMDIETDNVIANLSLDDVSD